MNHVPSRRRFLQDVAGGTFLTMLGASTAVELGLARPALAEQLDGELTFGDLEPLVCLLQETPLDRLQGELVSQLRGGLALKTLTAAGALANARTFGGEDYIGFHTFMALSPALRMSSLMRPGAEALPVLKVLYRNTKRIQEFGGRSSEVLHPVQAAKGVDTAAPGTLRQAIRERDARHAEEVLAAFVATDRLSALEALLPSVREHAEVHRVVLPYRAWEMQQIVGTEHATTLLRQSLRYCVRLETPEREEAAIEGKMLARVMAQYKLDTDAPAGKRPAEDGFVLNLARTFAEGSPDDAAAAAASGLAEGFAPDVVGEAISLAAAMLVLRDGGRLPQWEEPLKRAGTVHGDSVGVHASDSANAWRNLARISTGRHGHACLIMGAWQVARDRLQSKNLLFEALPAKYQVERVADNEPASLLAKLDRAIRDNMQGPATAIVQHYGSLELPAEPLFKLLAGYAVSEDGALHAEKYFQTVWDDFHISRPASRWLHLVALARVTASEYGRPADGQAEAKSLLGITA